MKAAVYREHSEDPRQVVKIEDIDAPKPKSSEVLIKAGATTGYDSTIDLRYLFFKGTNLLGATQGTKAGLEEVIRWVGKEKIKPVIDTILPFSNMVEGHLKMADSQLFGKILTTPQKL